MGGTLAPTAAPGGIAGTGIGLAQTGVAPPPPPEANLAYKKSGEESGGVMAMMDLMIADLDKDIQTSKVTEKDAQKEYEEFMADSSEKRALDSKAITDKAAAKAKVMRALRKARASLAKAQRGGKKATKAAAHVGHFRDASISDMKTLVSASVKAEMAKANVVATEDPLDKEIDQISVVRAREKAKDQVKQQLAQAAESMDLAESNDETPKHQPPTMSWIQLGMGSGMPAAKPPPPSPPNVPVADVKKDIPAKKALARATPKAPAGGAAMDSALKAAKPAKSPISTKKLPPKPDPNFSQADIDSAVKKISEFPMTDKDATKEGEKNQKSWDDKKKPKSRKATGPAMKKQNPLAKGSGSGKKKKE